MNDPASPPNPTPSPPPAAPVATLASLLKICAEPLAMDLQIRGTWLRFVGRRLRPPEVGRLLALLEAALPAALPPEKPGGETRYDDASPEYLARAEEQYRLARAYALFRGWPLFAEQAPPELDRNDARACADWLDSLDLEVAVLNALFKPLRIEVVGIDPERVSFY